jgi:hypothetical protein
MLSIERIPTRFDTGEPIPHVTLKSAMASPRSLLYPEVLEIADLPEKTFDWEDGK